MTRGRVAVLPSAALTMWGDWMRASGSRPKTIETRVRSIQALQGHAGLSDPTKATTTDLISWLGSCEAEWTRHTYWSSAHSWFTWLVQMEIRSDDPMARLPKPRKPSSLPRPAPTWAIQKVLADPPSKRAYAYVTLAAYCGLRVHEIAKVAGEDFDGGWLYVEGKGGQRAAVPVQERVARLANGQPPRGFWFPGSTDGHVNSHVVSTVVSSAMRATGANVTAHQLRHWFGTQVLRTSHDLRVAQE
ncbi:MAG: tyrosine-type recombinase/integrase, partial [Nocardioidaceae bacterium]